MDSNRQRWQPGFRFAAWVAFVYLVLTGGAIAIANILIRVLPCRPAGGAQLACPVLGVDVYNAIVYSGVAAWYGVFALPVVLLVIVIALVIGIFGWVSTRRESRAS